MNCCFEPFGIDGSVGVTAIDWSFEPVTVSSVEPVEPWKTAVIVVVPRSSAVAEPLSRAALEMVATDSCDELQVTWSVRSCVEPSA